MPRVLIVDDSETQVLALKDMLEKAGFGTLTASDGAQGMLSAINEKPDVILMDVVMPGVNGFQATRKLSQHPATASIPIIIITTKDQETDKVWGLRQGARDYIVKPCDETELLEKVKAVLA